MLLCATDTKGALQIGSENFPDVVSCKIITPTRNHIRGFGEFDLNIFSIGVPNAQFGIIYVTWVFLE